MTRLKTLRPKNGWSPSSIASLQVRLLLPPNQPPSLDTVIRRKKGIPQLARKTLRKGSGSPHLAQMTRNLTIVQNQRHSQMSMPLGPMQKRESKQLQHSEVETTPVRKRPLLPKHHLLRSRNPAWLAKAQQTISPSYLRVVALILSQSARLMLPNSEEVMLPKLLLPRMMVCFTLETMRQRPNLQVSHLEVNLARSLHLGQAKIQLEIMPRSVTVSESLPATSRKLTVKMDLTKSLWVTHSSM